MDYNNQTLVFGNDKAKCDEMEDKRRRSTGGIITTLKSGTLLSRNTMSFGDKKDQKLFRIKAN